MSANQYKVGTGFMLCEALMGHLRTIVQDPLLMHQLPKLRDKSIACWCPHDGEKRTECNRCYGNILEWLLDMVTDESLLAW